MNIHEKLQSVFIPNKIEEAPIEDFKHLGNWNKTSSFGKVDKALLTSPKGVEKIKNAFSKTDTHFNFYFLNDYKISKDHAERGVVTPDELKNIVGEEISSQIKFEPGVVSVVFLGNYGAEKKMMTSWIIAHRIGHAIAATDRRNFTSYKSNKAVKSQWEYFINEIKDMINNIILPAYGKEGWYMRDIMGLFNDREREIFFSKLFNKIGTFKSARDGKITRPFEFIYEMFAQYLMTGQIKFNDLPTHIKTKNNYYMMNKNDADYYSTGLHDYAEHVFPDHIENVLSSMKEKVLLM